MMRRQRSVWAKIASPLMSAPSRGSVLSRVRAAVISLASGATRHCPMTPCSRSLNAASRCTPGPSPTALPRSRLPSIAPCPAAPAPFPGPGRSPEPRRRTGSDPDGNGWLLQEVTTRLPGRVDPAATTFSSAGDLAKALERAAAAHGEHEKRTGRDANWPAWYAAYMVAEQAGTELPQ